MKKIATFFLIFCTLHTLAQDKKPRPSFSVVFDSSKGPSLLQQCSRASPQKVTAFWTPQQQDIDDLESNFFKLDTLAAKYCCIPGFKVGNLERYGIQYLGVIIKGRKYIYINAFSMGFYNEVKKRNEQLDPTKEPFTVCDGGPSFWGVLFDVESKEFSQLSFNGIA